MAERTTEFVLVLTSAASEEEAKHLARALVEAGLAACVNVVPGVTSIYRWKGQVTVGAEYLLVVKTRRALFSKVVELVRRLHSYELPELIVVQVRDGEAGYLAWLADGTPGKPPETP
jgi:periplasmic divalent cation tolerance protein